jgi:hypothetical protein
VLGLDILGPGSTVRRRARGSGSFDNVARDGVELRVDALHPHFRVGRDKVGNAAGQYVYDV